MMKITSLTKDLVNDYFYNPLKNKIPGNLEVIASSLNVSSEKIESLQYFDYETRGFINMPRVFKVHFEDKIRKVRYCRNRSEAESLFLRAKYAFSLDIPMSKPLQVRENLVIFSFVQGKNLDYEQVENRIHDITKLHSRFNTENLPVDEVETLLNNLTNVSFDYLHKLNVDSDVLSSLKSALDNRPEINVVFDHQDFGMHNIILGNDNKIYIMDEEAFGALPLGYSIIRPVFGRDNYRIVGNKNISNYLRFFPSEQKEYILSNIDYFKNLFILRNSVRRFSIGNEKGALRLLKETLK